MLGKSELLTDQVWLFGLPSSAQAKAAPIPNDLAGKHFRFPSIVIRYLTFEYIGCKKRTQGTETSKYLQERTSTETPQVVASERGPGQWH